MCQRLNTGESNNFNFGIFICTEPLKNSLLGIEGRIWEISGKVPPVQFAPLVLVQFAPPPFDDLPTQT